MNQSLKALISQRGMEAHKVEALAALIGKDGVKEVLSMAQSTEKSADEMRIRYKSLKDTAAAEPVDDGADDELTLSTADLAAIKGMIADALQGRAAAPALPAATKATKQVPVTLEALIKGSSWDGR